MFTKIESCFDKFSHTLVQYYNLCQSKIRMQWYQLSNFQLDSICCFCSNVNRCDAVDNTIIEFNSYVVGYVIAIGSVIVLYICCWYNWMM